MTVDLDRRSWLHSDHLELQVVINHCRGAAVDDWPPIGIWLRNFRNLKIAIDTGSLKGHRTTGEAIKRTTIRLDEAWRFLNGQDETWDWLSDFCREWADVRSVKLPTHLTPTARGEQACQAWLENEMRLHPRPKRTNADYLAEAQSKFGVSMNGFRRARANAISVTGKIAWRRAGRKSSR